jgi:hypothetical protein
MRLRVRKASIPDREREAFERFGASIVSAILYGGKGGEERRLTEPQQTVLYGEFQSREHAAQWLTEQYDRAERKETWSLIMEMAITVFVAFELLFSILGFVRGGTCTHAP